MTESSIEPQRRPSATRDIGVSSGLEEEANDRHEFSLPRVDGGKDAWLFLAACFTIEALTWGFPFAFGVFQDYYSTHEPFSGSSQIAVIGTCAMNTTHLIVTQGVVYAIGGSISYCPCILYMDEWFVKRKGFAYGIMWSGTGLAGFALPLLFEALLGRYGFRTTLRVWSLALFILTLPLAYFIKPRLPYSVSRNVNPLKLSFTFSRTFMLHQSANICQSLGFFMPSIYLPSYARAALGASTVKSALTVLLVNVASVFGCVAMGLLTDKIDVTTCFMLSAVGAGVSTFFVWGFSSSLPVLYMFCIVYGFFAGSYTTAWPGIMRQITSGQDSRSENTRTGSGSSFDPAMVMGMLSAGRGIGNLVSGPLSAVLLRGMPWQGQAAGGYGTGYGTLIVFTGTTALAGGATYLWRRVGWM
ncbi:hypothetical protein G7Z17_g778 [Cylindrodendrum hubeiense]|uniref:MFS monocarboxylate transporter n=1 Tax=Cylindrodendrum hubeiense TaxID=595255 RepID=A0A9P5LKQ7_9HYPO|nr:hypothetical protein G7Z17_g778 [Cylindrodendrum hubeiense]